MARDVNSPEARRRQQDLIASVAELQDVPAEDLFALFALLDVIELEQYQRNKSTLDLARTPLSPKFTEKYASSAQLLLNNTGLYEDAVEDAIAEDPVLTRLLQARRDNPNDLKLSSALRARRSVVLIGLMAFSEAQKQSPPAA